LVQRQTMQKLAAYAAADLLAWTVPCRTAVNTSCGGGDLMSEVERLRALAAEQEEQIDKQQQVIRYLQQAAGDAVGLSGATAGTLQHQQQAVEELRDVNEELRQQVGGWGVPLVLGHTRGYVAVAPDYRHARPCRGFMLLLVVVAAVP
jgi:uncharacterized membrane protein YcjF (UPF0283 family)